MFFTVSLACFTAFTLWFYVTKILTWNETRPDLVHLSDKLLDALPSYDTSFIVNLLQHSCHVFYLLQGLYWQSLDLNLTFLSFSLILWTRSVMISLCPLKVHPRYRVLNDPVQNFFIGPSETQNPSPFVNDLFFSGHVSISLLMGFTSGFGSWFFYCCTALMFFGLILSKVHYTIDCLVALYVSWGTYCLSLWMLNFLS